MLDTLDASACGNDFLNHGYFASSRHMIMDLAITLGRRLRAEQRRLYTVTQVEVCPQLCRRLLTVRT